MNEREQVLSSILFPLFSFHAPILTTSASIVVRKIEWRKRETQRERERERAEGENFLIPTFVSQRNGMRIPSKLTVHITG